MSGAGGETGMTEERFGRSIVTVLMDVEMMAGDEGVTRAKLVSAADSLGSCMSRSDTLTMLYWLHNRVLGRLAVDFVGG